MLCEYGCGQEAKFPPRKGMRKWCCSEYFSKCPSIKKVGKVAWNKGLTKETDNRVLKYSKSKIGQSSWNKGLTKENSKKVLEISKLISKSVQKFTLSKKIRITSSVKCGNLFVKPKIRKITITKTGMKYDKISLIKKKYPLFCNIENPEENENKDIIVKCKNCGKKFIPTQSKLYSRIYSIEKDEGGDGCYLYCSDECSNSCILYKLRPDYFIKDLIKEDQINTGTIQEPLYTSSEYQIFRQEVLTRANNLCEYCLHQATIVHHSRPQKLEPGFSLDPDFGIACCKECHYKYGHKDECSTGNLANIICS